MTSTELLKEALDTRIEIGDLTKLVTPVINNPIEYIGLVATEIVEQVAVSADRGEI